MAALLKALCVALVLVALAGQEAEARYLPTRGDDARLQEVAALLRDILEAAPPLSRRMVRQAPLAPLAA